MNILIRIIRNFSRAVFGRAPGDLLLLLQDHIAESARVFVMLVVLKPAAACLPANWSRSLAKKMSVIADIMPMDDGRSARTAMKRAFSLSDERAKELAREWLATQFSDFVALSRIACGRENPASWKVVEKNKEVIRDLRERNASFILGTAQFPRQAYAALWAGVIPRGKLIVAAQPRPPVSMSPRAMRLNIQAGRIYDAVDYLLAQEGSGHFIIGEASISTLIQHLRLPGNIVHVTIDAHWLGKNGTFRRPFAGHTSFSLTTGPALLAQVAKCPIVLCLTSIDTDGTLVVEWGPVISPPPPGDANGHIRVTDELLNRIERAVGEKPAQYVNAIGVGRAWNSRAGQWEDPQLVPSLVSRIAANGNDPVTNRREIGVDR